MSLNFTAVTPANCCREKNQHGNLNLRDENSKLLVFSPLLPLPFLLLFLCIFHAVLVKLKIRVGAQWNCRRKSFRQVINSHYHSRSQPTPSLGTFSSLPLSLLAAAHSDALQVLPLLCPCEYPHLELTKVNCKIVCLTVGLLVSRALFFLYSQDLSAWDIEGQCHYPTAIVYTAWPHRCSTFG